MLENSKKISACRITTKNHEMTINKITKSQHGCAEIY